LIAASGQSWLGGILLVSSLTKLLDPVAGFSHPNFLRGRPDLLKVRARPAQLLERDSSANLWPLLLWRNTAAETPRHLEEERGEQEGQHGGERREVQGVGWQ
jgi:hypothetical protein